MIKNQFLKKLSVGIASLALVCPLALNTNFTVNAKVNRARTTAIRRHKNKYTYKKGIPKKLDHEWFGPRKYLKVNGHRRYDVTNYEFSRDSSTGSVNMYNLRNHWIAGGSAFDSWWNPYTKYMGNHIYQIISGDIKKGHHVPSGSNSRRVRVQLVKKNRANIWYSTYGYPWTYSGYFRLVRYHKTPKRMPNYTSKYWSKWRPVRTKRNVKAHEIRMNINALKSHIIKSKQLKSDTKLYVTHGDHYAWYVSNKKLHMNNNSKYKWVVTAPTTSTWKF